VSISACPRASSSAATSCVFTVSEVSAASSSIRFRGCRLACVCGAFSPPEPNNKKSLAFYSKHTFGQRRACLQANALTPSKANDGKILVSVDLSKTTSHCPPGHRPVTTRGFDRERADRFMAELLRGEQSGGPADETGGVAWWAVGASRTFRGRAAREWER
jgi:hypothetical protein